jgi:hypothetical protein
MDGLGYVALLTFAFMNVEAWRRDHRGSQVVMVLATILLVIRLLFVLVLGI